MGPMMYLVMFMCMRTEPAKCEVWNMDYSGVSWKGCATYAEHWKDVGDENPYYKITHIRCSLNKFEVDWLR
jgi:hypothetical protein